MRTRKTFIHEDGVYGGVSYFPEPTENHSKEVVSIDNPYDWYPEKQPFLTTETENFESAIDLPLGEEYKLHSRIDY